MGGLEIFRAEIANMQVALRAWVSRAAGGDVHGLRGAPAPIVLSLLCAAAVSPVLAAAAGLGAVAVTGIGVLSSVSGGALSAVIAEALGRASSDEDEPAPSSAAIEKEIAEGIAQVLKAGNASAQLLRTEIAMLLKEIDAGGTVLRAAMEDGNERVRSELIAAIGLLGSSFGETGFLIRDVAQAAAAIQSSLDVQGADVRAIIEQNNRQSADIRIVRENVATIARRASSVAPGSGGHGEGPRWVRGCPYRGLLPFGETDVEVFYGRERLTAQVAVRVAGLVAQGGLLVMTGASGAGKSSLLHAGLLPALARGQQVTGSENWPRIAITPTADPLAELAAHLAALGGSDALAVNEGLTRHPSEAHLAVWQAVLADASRREPQLGGSSRLVLIVDQFEQVFTLNVGPDGESKRRTFMTALYAAATRPVGPAQEPPALVVIAVRGDFWDRCAAYPEFADALQNGQIVVGPMTESDLRLAITGPAASAGLHIESGLVDVILDDLRTAVGDNAGGALPLLSQAMSLTWDSREGDQLTSHGYGKVGGVSRAVQTSADTVYDALPTEQQTLATEVIRSMTVASPDGRFTRRPMARADLYATHPEAEQSQIDAILEAFAAERLMVLDGDRAQLSHDVLLTAWPRLRSWLEEDRISWVLHGELAVDADAWHDSDGDSSFLYRGTQLAAAREAERRWAAHPRPYPALTQIQRDFLRTSERAAARSRQRRRGGVALLAVLALTATVASGLALQQRGNALRQRDQAILNDIAAEAFQLGSSDPSLAAQLNLVAYRMQPTQALASRLLGTENSPLSAPLITSNAVYWAVAYSPNGQVLAIGNSDGSVALWDMANQTSPHQIVQFPVDSNGSSALSAAFSPDGRTLAVGLSDGTTCLWNVANLTGPQQLAQVGTTNSGNGNGALVAFSPDGRTLAAGQGDNSVGLWDVAKPSNPKLLGQLPAAAGGVGDSVSVAFSPGSPTLASGSSDGSVRLWDVADRAHPKLIGRPFSTTSTITGDVFSVAFSPDGQTLAAGTGRNTVQLWDMADSTHPKPIDQPSDNAGPIGSIYSVAFSAHAPILASGSSDGSVQLWDLTHPAYPHPLGQALTAGTISNGVQSVAFSPDGVSLASGGVSTVRLWSMPPTTLTGLTGQFTNSVTFIRSRRILAVGKTDGTVQLWNAADPLRPHVLGQPMSVSPRVGAVNSVAFGPDRRILATGSSNGAVRLWDVSNPTHPGSLSPPLTAGSAVLSMAFSPDGRTLAAGDINGTVMLWNIADSAHPQPLGQAPSTDDGAISSVTFSPDGHTLAASSSSGMVHLLNVATPADSMDLGQVPNVSTAGVLFSVAFSPVRPILATGSSSGTIRLWDLSNPANPRQLGQPMPTSSIDSSVASVAFSPDGRTLVSGSANGTVQLWNVANPASPQHLSQPFTESSTGRPIGSVAFGSDSHTLVIGNAGASTTLWDLRVGDAIKRICATSENNLTRQQWLKYIPQLTYKPPCG